MKSFYLLLFLVFMVSCHKKKMSAEDSLQDSIEFYLDKSSQNYDTLPMFHASIDKATRFNASRAQDSLYFVNNLKISFAYHHAGLNQKFKEILDNNLRLALSLKDTLNIARSYAHIGNYYSFESKSDSAVLFFQLAEKKYALLQNNFEIGRWQLAAAEEKFKSRDYIGAEKSAASALRFLKLSNSIAFEYEAYNLLGSVCIALGDYDKSSKYLNKALLMANTNDLESYGFYFTKETTLNNLANLKINEYKFNEALEYIAKALMEKEIEKEYPLLYAALHYNRARSYLALNKLEEAYDDISKCYYIRESNNFNKVIPDAYLLYASYYVKTADTVKALEYCQKALKLSKELNILNLQVKSLDALSKINDESFLNYAQEYITLNDSLINLERKNAEKFARIEFEADELEREKGELLQKNKTLWRWGSTSAVFLGLVFVIYFQRNRHRHLKNKQKQEELNLSVYRLMLSRQEELERVRQEEKNRIAEELHDNIMNKMAAVRFNLTPLEFEPDPETVRKTLPYIHSIQDIEKEIRKLSHDLHREVFQSQQDYRALLEQLFNEYQNQKVRLFVEINKEIRWDRFSAEQKMHLYRLLQEGITNVMKHAGATQLKIHLHLLEKDLFEMELEDNGKGMGALTQEGLGLKTMKKRVDAMGGNLHFSKVDPKGTLVQIHIPLQADDNSQK